MRAAVARALQCLAGWLQPKAMPVGLVGSPWLGTAFGDSWHRRRAPSAAELLCELKNTAWSCASINAGVCASYAPRLYAVTHDDQAPPKCLTRRLDAKALLRLRAQSGLKPHHARAARIEEVIEHPLLTLLRQVNPIHNSFDLLELTTLYQEVHGSAYWYLPRGPWGVPEAIWILPSQFVTPRRRGDSPNLVDFYEYQAPGQPAQQFATNEVIHFRYPDPRDPYTAGLSPLRACWEQVRLSSDYAGLKGALYDHHALPSAVVSPEEVIGEEERDRLEAQWNAKLRHGGNGQVIVAESGLKVQLLSQSLGDLSALADMKATRDDICNAFHVPISFLSSETNLANLQAAEHQHAAKAVRPRLRRRDEKLNEQLVPLFDTSGRLFLASEDPVTEAFENGLKADELYLRYGVLTINEVRQAQGLPAVSWGDRPWLPQGWSQEAGAQG
jgi:HK97 family phage portal protein